MKLTNIMRKLWEHKKKSAFASVAAYFIGWKIYCWKRNWDIRTIYAREAKLFGDAPLASSERLRRVTVLVDTTCTGAFDSFKKNALPLFNLAGLQVDIIKPTNISEFKTIAEHIDAAEGDALYIIGGDNSLSTVLSAMYQQKNNSPIPIGVFPGGSDNRSLINLVPNVFGVQNDIRPHCESAMALIEEQIRPIYLSRVRFENSENSTDDGKEPLYGISGLQVGWYDRIETSKNKLWYWGRLKRWIAYITAYLHSLKQYPEVELNMICMEYCTGCSKCRSQSMIEETKQQKSRQWWYYIIGSRNYADMKNIKPKMDYSLIQNANCGKTKEMKVKAVDIAFENVQDQNACSLRIRTGGAECSRINLLMDGWKRCQTKQPFASQNTSFYQNDLSVKSVILKFNLLPDAFKKMTIFGNDYKMDNDLKTRIILESTNNDKTPPNVQTPDKGLKVEKKEIKRLPKVDEELRVRTIFEPVAVEARPAKAKPKIRNKLKWKEDVSSEGKTDESKGSSTDSADKAVRLNVTKKKESDQIKAIIASEKSEKSIESTDKVSQSILWMIVGRILEEIFIAFIIIIILIIMRIRTLKIFAAH